MVRAAASAMVVGVASLLAAYGVFWAHNLVVLPPEIGWLATSRIETDQPYAWLLGLWGKFFGAGLTSARMLSVLAVMAAFVLTLRAGRRFGLGGVGSAALALPFVFYPPLVAIYAAAMPHALTVLLALAALEALLGTPVDGKSWILRGAAAGIFAVVAMSLHPLGWIAVTLWLALCAALLAPGQRKAAVVALILAISGAVLAANELWAESELNLGPAGYDSVLRGLLLPFAMVIVTTLLSALAALSAQVRAGLGVSRTVAMVLGPVLAAAILWGLLRLGVLATGQSLSFAALLFPFAIPAAAPLVVWVTRVMPQVKSLAAWIVFPVVMYCCFWVVLGPVKSDRFPYTHRQLAQPGPIPDR